MAIGVSYTGIGGKRTNFTAAGGNAAFEELRRLQSESGSMLQQMMQRRGGGGGSAPRTTNEQRRQMKERDREAKYERLRALGIEREGKKKTNPFEQWADRLGKDEKKVELDKIDPRRSGNDITGKAKSGKEPSDTNRAASGKEPFTESYLSDLFMDEVKDGNDKTVGFQIYKYRRRRSNTGQGRVFAVSKEECEPLGGMLPAGGGGGGGGGMFAWDEATGTMGPGGAMVGRTWVDASGTGAKGNGTYYLQVTFGSGGSVSAAVTSSSGSTTDTVCYIPIYTIADGKISADYRGAFVVPCWE